MSSISICMYTCVYLYIYIYICVCMCVISCMGRETQEYSPGSTHYLYLFWQLDPEHRVLRSLRQNRFVFQTCLSRSKLLSTPSLTQKNTPIVKERGLVDVTQLCDLSNDSWKPCKDDVLLRLDLTEASWVSQNIKLHQINHGCTARQSK